MPNDCANCRGKEKRCGECLAYARRYMRGYQSGMKQRYFARGVQAMRQRLIDQFRVVAGNEMTGYTAAEIVRVISIEQ